MFAVTGVDSGWHIAKPVEQARECRGRFGLGIGVIARSKAIGASLPAPSCSAIRQPALNLAAAAARLSVRSAQALRVRSPAF